MRIIFTPLFFGFFFILLGISIIVKIFFKTRIPVFRITIAFILLLIGLKLLSAAIPSLKISNLVIFEKKDFDKSVCLKNYYVIFGESKINLRNISFFGDIKTIRIINFGSKAIVTYPDSYPIIVKVKNIFSDTSMPRRDLNIFGKDYLVTSVYDESRKYTKLFVTTIFGTTDLRVSYE